MSRERQRQAVVELLVELMALGVPPSEAASQLERTAGRPAHRVALRRLRAALDQGKDLPPTPELLPAELPALISAGQRAGVLTDVMQQAARYLVAMHRAVRAALLPLVYPLGLLLVLWLVSNVLQRTLVSVSGAGQGAPGVIACLASPTFGAALLLLAAALAYWAHWRRRLGASVNLASRLVEATIGRLPGLRPLFEQPAVAAAAGSLAVTLDAGVDGSEALQLAADSCRSARLQRALREAGRVVASGTPLQHALDRRHIPEALRAVARAAGAEDWPRAMAQVSKAALAQLEHRVRRVSVVVFSLGLVVAALGVGLALATAYGVIVELPGGVGG